MFPKSGGGHPPEGGVDFTARGKFYPTYYNTSVLLEIHFIYFGILVPVPEFVVPTGEMTRHEFNFLLTALII